MITNSTESDDDVVENTEEAALDEFIRQETELTAYSIKANAGSIHSPSHPCWAGAELYGKARRSPPRRPR